MADFWNNEWESEEEIIPTEEQVDEDEQWLNSILEQEEEEDDYADLRADPYLSDWIPPSLPLNNVPVSNNNFLGIFRNEGAKTGQPTNLNSSALGRGQMIKGTREAMYKKLGFNDIQNAEQRFRTDPDFEMQVMNAYREELDERIPKNIVGKQRERMIAKGWYTGDPFYDDNKVPGKSAGNKLTAGEYARRATMQYGGVNNIPDDLLDNISDETIAQYLEEEGVDIEQYVPEDFEQEEESKFQKVAGIGLQAVDKFNQIKGKIGNVADRISKSVSDSIDAQTEMAGYQRNAQSMRKFNQKKNSKKYTINKTPLNQPLIYI